MGVDIFWRAFDDEEVERMWSEYPLGELISLVEGDKLFWQRRKDFVPEETLRNRKKRAWQAKMLLPKLQKICEAANTGKDIVWNVINGLPEHVSQADLLNLDQEFITYFTYMDAGGRYSVYSDATQAMYEARGLEFNENNFFFESMTPRWLSIMRETDFETISAWLTSHVAGNSATRFPPITDMDDIKDDAEQTLTDIREVVRLFDFANANCLPIYAEVGMLGYDIDCGAGEHNLVNRFEKRFAGVEFPHHWKKYSVYRSWSPELDETPKPPQLPRSDQDTRYVLYVFNGDDYFNIRKLTKTAILIRAISSLPRVEGKEEYYTISPYRVSVSLPIFRRGCGARISFPLFFGDPVPAYTQAVKVGLKVAQSTGLNLYDPHIRAYVTVQNSAESRQKFLDYARRARQGEDVPSRHVPRWRGKKWPEYV